MLNRYASAVIAVGVVILAGILIAMTIGFYKKLNDRLFEERKTYLIEFTDKVTEVMDSTVELSWKELSSCEHILVRESESIGNTNQLLGKMTSMQDVIDTDTMLVIAIDEKGNYYSSDGETGYWEETSIFENTEENRQQAIVEIPHIQGTNFLLFIRKLNQSVVIQDSERKVTYIAVALKSEALNEQLSITGFGEECYSYIINDYGRQLYQNTYNHDFIDGYNIFKSIDNYKVINGGDFQTLENAVHQGESTALEFEYVDSQTGDTREWFVADSNMSGNGWHVLLFVPENVLGASTNSLISETIRTFTIISVIIIAIFVLMMFVIVSGRADKRIIRQKEASNILLAEAAEKAESANMAKSEFLSRMSHDIRTPINAIIGMTAIAMKHIDDKDRVSDCLCKIDGASQHLFSLINDVLDMSQIESGKITLINESFNLSACLVNCASIIDGQLASRDVRLIRNFESFKNPVVIGDELHLRQIFINILGNSVKFTPDGGWIYFRAQQIEKDGKSVFRFEMEDTGIGMAPEYLPHLFEAFTQENGGSRTTYKGTGLGMAIVKQFVDMMDGSIEVESTLNVGTKFVIEIPFMIDTEVKTEKTKEKHFNLKGMKVLLVEDNALNTEIAKELLEEEGVIVTTAENGQRAVDIYQSTAVGTFDAILMDVMMPVMDGLTATRVIRSSNRQDAHTIPVLAMTANAYEEDIRKTRDAGMNAHLSKPINVDMLYTTLANYYNGQNEKDVGAYD